MSFDHSAIFGTTSTPCPPWCDLEPGHGYDVGDHTCETRIHTHDLGGLRIDGREEVSVTIHAAENLTYGEDGLTISVEPPLISVESAGTGLTGSQAREVAAKLIAAAELWDRVTS